VPPAPFLTCNGNILSNRPGDQTSVTVGPRSDSFIVTPDTAQIPQGAVVLQVHTNDRRAASCSAELRPICNAAVIVDRVLWPASTPTGPDIGSRYPDGIPSEIDGAPVLRPADALARAQTATDDTPFLVGGWRGGYVVAACIPRVHPPAEPTLDPLFDQCSGYVIRDGPGADRSAIRIPPVANLPDAPGPIVVRVHVHDLHADECGGGPTSLCEQAFVLDAVVWAGDAETETSPLAIDDVVRRLARATPDLTVTPFLPGDRLGCNPGWPPQSWMAREMGFGMRRLRRILVFPSSAEAAATIGRLSSSGYVGQPNASGQSCTVAVDGLVTSTWLLQDNVIVEVLLPPDTAFVDKVRHDLATEP
jgi:hypothetical protein